MKAIKPPLFSPTQFAINMNKSIGLTTLGEAIARNHCLLREHIFDSPLDVDDYAQLLEAIRAVTNEPALQAELETRWRNQNSKQDEETNTLQRHVRYACLYLELARTAEAHKDRERAWAFTNYASLMIGEIIEKSAAAINAMEADKRSDKNSKNAQGRNKSILLVKNEAARLLVERQPENGWPTKIKAVYHLEDPLAEFIEKNNIPALKISNIEKWLTAWLREDVLVNQAWEKTKHAKAR
ncbi:hypothetical protein CWC48_14275 [Pseudomonas sp. S10E 269]|jgi:hypothetical protein|uniref:hypothetical protein n=1 Tax=Pseudomonas TaxID=286 RepID=UPI000C25CDCE|nr:MULTISPECIES: hypothetical protein [Pseudomonas]MDR6165582.1 hypothetical protein [Pseudomonas fluorescens]PJK36312.1 hypothetical protein CWC49_24425 [Pseudomonas sp. S09F 262]PJK40257.1 hypothetical protein CWC48_14275 [Pseudomonas sp. S10E 269]